MEVFRWDSIEELFQVLNNGNCVYVVLRNFEEMDDENFCSSDHADIDFLTADNRAFVSLIKAYPRSIEDDRIHYKVNINGEEVDVDVRTVGDEYYDKKWEKDILETRVLSPKGFYIPNEETYYYSLAYHAILQKPKLTDEYLLRLNQMAAALGRTAHAQEEHLDLLEQYMRAKEYSYTIPYDIWVVLNDRYIDKNRIKKAASVYIRDAKMTVLRTGSRIKHKILGR